MIGKWHLGSDPTGFDYWNILPGQGAYHDPVFIEARQAHEAHRLLHRPHHRLLASTSSTSGPRTSRSSSCATTRRRTGPGSPTRSTARSGRTCRCPSRRPSTTTTPRAPPAASEATMRIDRDLTPTDLKQKPPAGLTGAALKKWKYQRYMRDYLACVESMDDNVGRLLDYLDKNGLAENTIVVYTSDQGFFLGDHDWFDKRFMYEESLRMPFLVRWPGKVKAGIGQRRHDPQRRLRPDAAGRRRPAGARRHAGPQLPAAARGQDAEGLADVDVLPLLPLPPGPPGPAALRRPHRALQADLLQQDRPVGAVRPPEGPAS